MKIHDKMNKLYIMTTATPRAELHSKTYFPVLKMLRDEGFDVVPIVNLDKPDIIPDSAFDDAKVQFEEAGVYLYVNNLNPSFSMAARNLYNNCNRLQSTEDNNLFFWLEDDWIFDTFFEEEFINVVKSMFTNEVSTLVTCKHKYVGGNPCFFKQPLFDEIVKLWDKTPENLDPEFAHFEASRIVEGVEKWRIPSKKGLSFEIPIFHDAGRQWRETNKIGKRARFKKASDTWFADINGSTEKEKRTTKL